MLVAGFEPATTRDFAVLAVLSLAQFVLTPDSRFDPVLVRDFNVGALLILAAMLDRDCDNESDLEAVVVAALEPTLVSDLREGALLLPNTLLSADEDGTAFKSFTTTAATGTVSAGAVFTSPPFVFIFVFAFPFALGRDRLPVRPVLFGFSFGFSFSFGSFFCFGSFFGFEAAVRRVFLGRELK